LTFTAGENEKDPTMSPDGRFVAYTSNPGANRDVFLLDVNTGDVTRLTNAPGGDETPSWSPDGTKIVFSSERAGGTPHIFVMNADGSGVKQLTSGLKADSMPKFSPDGEHIAFARGPA
jgi:TolB protein